MAGKYLLTTLGCKVNQYESQQIRELIESFGLRPIRDGETPDIAVVNTCAVTTTASRKSRQSVRSAAGASGTPVVVVGCGASADTDRLARLDGVTAVLGHGSNVCDELRSLLVARFASTPPARGAGVGKHRNVRRNDVWIRPTDTRPPRASVPPAALDASKKSIDLTLPVVKSPQTLAARIERFHGHQRAFLKVQDGCDACCTYCIIPSLRTRLLSKPVDQAVAEAHTLVANGHKEIVVTGIFLGAYGRDTALRKRFAPGPTPLAELIRALARVDGLRRLRLSSLEPGDVDETLLEVLATGGPCVPHLHLPLQSGSDPILRRMNRQYRRDDFLDMVKRVRGALDRPAISTDIIVGFPGETERDFQASLEIARYAEFCKIHAFPFSPRPGTAAARWGKDFVHPTEVRDRMRRLARVELECSLTFRRRFLGRMERVIVERSNGVTDVTRSSPGLGRGRADRYFEIHFDADAPIRDGDLVSVRIDRVTPTRTHGTHLPAAAH